jgi:hypothetical protein
MSTLTPATSALGFSATARTQALEKLKVLRDINLLHKLLQVFHLGRFSVTISALIPHAEQRPVDSVWVKKLATLFQTSTPLDYQFPGIAIANSLDWPRAGLDQTTTPSHPKDADGKLLPATIIEGQHRVKAKIEWAQNTGHTEQDHVWTFDIYHQGASLTSFFAWMLTWHSTSFTVDILEIDKYLMQSWIYSSNVQQDKKANDPVLSRVRCVGFIDHCYTERTYAAIPSGITSFGQQGNVAFANFMRHPASVSALRELLDKVPMWRNADLTGLFNFFNSGRMLHVSSHTLPYSYCSRHWLSAAGLAVRLLIGFFNKHWNK